MTLLGVIPQNEAGQCPFRQECLQDSTPYNREGTFVWMGGGWGEEGVEDTNLRRGIQFVPVSYDLEYR